MKLVVKLDIHDERDKKKAMNRVSSIAGLDLISVDMKGKTLTVTGDFDPVKVMTKLRKSWHANIETAGPEKEPEKKKEEAKKQDDNKKDNAPSDTELIAELVRRQNYYNASHMPLPPPYYFRADENPNSCVIC